MAKYQPFDKHNRLIEEGHWLFGNDRRYLFRVMQILDEAEVDKSSGGFRALCSKEPLPLGSRGIEMGKEVKWEIVALGGDKPPRFEDVQRDSEGRPILTPEIQFAVGQNVKVVRTSFPYSEDWVPRSGTIVGLYADGSCRVDVGETVFCAWQRDLEAVPESAVGAGVIHPKMGRRRAQRSFAALASDSCINEVLVPVTLRLIQETQGQALDDLARELGTTRIGEDTDEELQEQLGRILFKQGPMQALDFLSELTKDFMRTNYPDFDRDLKKAKEEGKKHVKHKGVAIVFMT